jgi:hypothetical protein
MGKSKRALFPDWEVFAISSRFLKNSVQAAKQRLEIFLVPEERVETPQRYHCQKLNPNARGRAA